MIGSFRTVAGTMQMQNAAHSARCLTYVALGVAWLAPSLGTAMPCAAWQQSYPESRVTVHCGQAPSAVVDTQGRLWVVFVQEQHVYVARSDDVGATFAPPVRVTTAPEDAEHNGENRPKIVVAEQPGDTPAVLLLSWTRKTSRNFTGDIRFSRSLDGGQHFSEPQTVNDDGLFTGHRFDSLFLTESGRLYLTWIDKREVDAAAARGDPYVGAALYYATSSDLGATFSQNQRVAHNSCECCRIAMAPYGTEKVTILWRHVFDGGIRDHAMAVLGPDGVDSAPRRATLDDWRLDACPHHGPAIIEAKVPGLYHMSWFSAGTAQAGILYGRYALHDAQASEVLTVDATPGAGHPTLARAGGRLLLAWKAFDGTASEIRLVESHDEGRSWSVPRVVLRTTAASDHPLVVATQHRAFLSWKTEEFGYVFRAL